MISLNRYHDPFQILGLSLIQQAVTHIGEYLAEPSPSFLRTKRGQGVVCRAVGSYLWLLDIGEKNGRISSVEICECLGIRHDHVVAGIFAQWGSAAEQKRTTELRQLSAEFVRFCDRQGRIDVQERKTPVDRTGYASAAEVAAYLKKSPSVIYGMVRDERLPAERDGSELLIPWSAVYAYARRPRKTRGAISVPKDLAGEWMLLSEAREVSQLSVLRLRELSRDGVVPRVRRGGVVFIHRESLERFLAGRGNQEDGSLDGVRQESGKQEAVAAVR